jgi:peptidoglycan/LPS O-acetylase OafA/YrhL
MKLTTVDRPVAPVNAGVSHPKQAARIDWLDGVRGCSAVYVMLHHIYLFLFPGFPVNNGPWMLGWLMYGQLAVVVFIVVSGFSLGLAPARSRNDLQHGASTFYHRRAWRILPPYWIALLFSMSIFHFLLPESPSHAVNLRTFVVYGLLLQDVVPSVSPNAAFWSIAVEAQIYIVFPVMLILSRARSAKIMALAVLILICVAHWLALHFQPFSRIDHFTPQLLVGFAFGVWTADEVASPSPRLRRLPLLWIAAGLTAAFWTLCASIGFVAVNDHYFWIDVLAAFIVAIGFVGFVETRSWVAEILGSRPLRFLGQFSYSLYLIHAPLVALLITYWIVPRIGNPLISYLFTASVVAPLVIAASYLFFLVFERPFLTIRSWTQLRAWVTRGLPFLVRRGT